MMWTENMMWDYDLWSVIKQWRVNSTRHAQWPASAEVLAAGETLLVKIIQSLSPCNYPSYGSELSPIQWKMLHRSCPWSLKCWSHTPQCWSVARTLCPLENEEFSCLGKSVWQIKTRRIQLPPANTWQIRSRWCWYTSHNCITIIWSMSSETKWPLLVTEGVSDRNSIIFAGTRTCRH